MRVRLPLRVIESTTADPRRGGRRRGTGTRRVRGDLDPRARHRRRWPPPTVATLCERLGSAARTWLLMDVRMPIMDGIAAIEEIVHASPSTSSADALTTFDPDHMCTTCDEGGDAGSSSTRPGYGSPRRSGSRRGELFLARRRPARRTLVARRLRWRSRNLCSSLREGLYVLRQVAAGRSNARSANIYISSANSNNTSPTSCTNSGCATACKRSCSPTKPAWFNLAKT